MPFPLKFPIQLKTEPTTYSTKTDVEFWAQLGTSDIGAVGPDYDSSITKAIQTADRIIDDYCNVPEGYFQDNGVTITDEYLNGVDVAYLGGITKFFQWYYGGTSHLKLKYRPVLSVTSLEEETSAGTWTTRTEGTGDDYIVIDDGVRFVTNTPAWKYKNVRVTYKAGYDATPSHIRQASARLAATVLHQIIDSKERTKAVATGVSVDRPDIRLSTAILTEDLEKLLSNYRRVIYAFS